MQVQPRKLLNDMRDAASEIDAIVRSKSLLEFLSDRQLRWSVERGFEIIGEALSQLKKVDAILAQRISDHRKIVSFRNILIHNYSGINDSLTWDIVQNDLPVLVRELDALLKE